MATATQEELGGPGGESNPEELFAAALANCFTSTLTGMARAREIPLGEIETARGDHALVGRRRRITTCLTRRCTRGWRRRLPRSRCAALIAEAEAECPVCQAISGKVALHVTADVVTETA